MEGSGSPCDLCPSTGEAHNESAVAKLFHSPCSTCSRIATTYPTELCSFCRHLRLRHLIHCVAITQLEYNIRSLSERSETCRLCQLLKSAIRNQIDLVYSCSGKDFTTRPIWLAVKTKSTLSWRLEHTADEGAFDFLSLEGLLEMTLPTQKRPQSAAPAFVDWSQINSWPTNRVTLPGNLAQVSKAHDIKKFRVVDVLKYSVVFAPQTCNYIALSYVWGQPSPQHFESTVANINTLEMPGALRKQSFPRTLSDAMEACRKLGYQYLWVDALCIVQDDFENKEDQINQMDKIYRGAALCIIAAAGLDSDHGLPGVTCARRWSQVVGRVHDISLYSQLSSAETCVRADKWATRGWTYQEFYLPDRLLYFTEFGAFYFDRRPGILNTDNPGFLTDQSACAEKHADGHLFMSSNWCTTLWAYSFRRLSFADDILKAFLGLLNHKFPEGHTYGLPYEVFDQCILWSCLDFMSTPRTAKGQIVFPSWSWTSTSGPIMLSQGLHCSVAFWAISTATSVSEGRLAFAKPGSTFLNEWADVNWVHSCDMCLFACALGCVSEKGLTDLSGGTLDPSQAGIVKQRWKNYPDYWAETFGPWTTKPPFSKKEIAAAQIPSRLLVHTQEAVLGIESIQEVDGRVPGRRMVRIRDKDGACIGAIFLSDYQANRFSIDSRKAAQFIALSVCSAIDSLSGTPWNHDQTNVDAEFFNRHNSGQAFASTTSTLNNPKYPQSQYPPDICFWKADGSPAELAVMNVMLIMGTQPDDDQIVQRVGIGQVFLKKWGEAKRTFKSFILE